MKKLKEIWKYNWDRFRSLSLLAWVVGVGIPVLNYLLYLLGDRVAKAMGTAPFEPRIPWLDDIMPFWPVFVIIYLYSYVFWGKGYACLFYTDKRHRINTLCAVLTGLFIGFLILAFFPTLMDRTKYGLFEKLEGGGLIRFTLQKVYQADGGDVGPNCLPSFHVLQATYAYLCVRKRPEISKGYRIFSAVMVWLVPVSTLVLKQHYFLDIVTGAALAIGTYAFFAWLDPAGRIEKRKLKKPTEDFCSK